MSQGQRDGSSGVPAPFVAPASRVALPGTTTSGGGSGNGAIGSSNGAGVVVKKKRPVAAAEPASFSEPRPPRAAGPRQKKQADDGKLGHLWEWLA